MPGDNGNNSDRSIELDELGTPGEAVESAGGESLDPFHALFDTDDVEAVDVELYRTEPTTLNGVKIHGFLERLYPGADRAQIAALHGGGTYRLSKRDRATGRMITNRTLEISGRPIMPKDKQPDEQPMPLRAESALNPEDDAWFRELKKTMMMKAALGSDESMSKELLKMLVEQNANRDKLDLQTVMTGIAGVFELVKNFSADKSTDDSGLLGMLTGLLGKLGREKSGEGSGVLRATDGAAGDLVTSVPTHGIADVPQVQINPVGRESESAMNPQAVLSHSFQIVMNGYLLSQPVNEVAQLIDVQLSTVPGIEQIVRTSAGLIRAGFQQFALEHIDRYDVDSKVKAEFDLFSNEVMRRFLASDFSEPVSGQSQQEGEHEQTPEH